MPLALNDRAATGAPVAIVAPDWLCVAMSQSRTSPSSPPAARSFPSELNASALTAAGPAVIVVPTSCWVAASHSWIVPSLLAAATVAPSGLNATASTGVEARAHRRADFLLGGHVPQPDVPVVAAGGQGGAVRAERGGPAAGTPVRRPAAAR